MTLSQIETKMIKVVVGKFMKCGEPTNRKELVTRFAPVKAPVEAVDRLVSVGALRKLDDDNNLAPLCLGIQYAGNFDFLEQAKTSLEITLYVLQHLYEINPRRKQLTLNEVVRHAVSMYRNVSPDVIELGLYFLQELHVLDSYGPGRTQAFRGKALNIAWMVISERIVTIDAERAWDEHVRARRASKEVILGIALGTGKARVRGAGGW
jgi:hypothetical protein